MLLSSENIANLPFALDTPRTQAVRWTWPEFTLPFPSAQAWIKHLRVPGPQDGAGYRVKRLLVLNTLRAANLFGTRIIAR